MDTKTFRNIVAEEVKGRCTPGQQAFLAEHMSQWREALQELDVMTDQRVTELESQLVGIRSRMSDLESIPSELIVLELELISKADKASHFLKHVRSRLASLNIDSSDVRTSDPDEAEFLRRAIRAHKRLLDDGADADQTDAALYAALDGTWKFDEILHVG